MVGVAVGLFKVFNVNKAGVGGKVEPLVFLFALSGALLEVSLLVNNTTNFAF